MEIQLSDAPSIYVTGTGTILGLKGFGIVVTGRRMPAWEVPDPNRLLGNISIALCLLLISFLSFWLVLTWNCSVTVCNKEPLQRHACIFRLGVGEGIWLLPNHWNFDRDLYSHFPQILLPDQDGPQCSKALQWKFAKASEGLWLILLILWSKLILQITNSDNTAV